MRLKAHHVADAQLGLLGQWFEALEVEVIRVLSAEATDHNAVPDEPRLDIVAYLVRVERGREGLDGRGELERRLDAHRKPRLLGRDPQNAVGRCTRQERRHVMLSQLGSQRELDAGVIDDAGELVGIVVMHLERRQLDRRASADTKADVGRQIHGGNTHRPRPEDGRLAWHVEAADCAIGLDLLDDAKENHVVHGDAALDGCKACHVVHAILRDSHWLAHIVVHLVGLHLIRREGQLERASSRASGGRVGRALQRHSRRRARGRVDRHHEDAHRDGEPPDW